VKCSVITSGLPRPVAALYPPLRNFIPQLRSEEDRADCAASSLASAATEIRPIRGSALDLISENDSASFLVGLNSGVAASRDHYGLLYKVHSLDRAADSRSP